MDNSERQTIVNQTIVIINVAPQPPPAKFKSWLDFITKASLLSMPWLLDHAYAVWPLMFG